MPKRKILIQKWSYGHADAEDLLETGKFIEGGFEPFSITPGMKQAPFGQPKMINMIWFKKAVLGRKEIDMGEDDAKHYDDMCKKANTDALQVDYRETVDNKMDGEKKGIFG